MEVRYRGLFHELWAPALAFLIRYQCDRYFRFFDSGDLQGANHLKNIVTIARAVPDVNMWLPTREVETVRAVLREVVAFPENLVVRVSAALVDGPPSQGFRFTSTVVSDPAHASCVAQRQGNRCAGEVRDCRDCWVADTVSYPLH